MVAAKKKMIKKTKRARHMSRKASRSSSVIDVRSPSDVKKALDILNKSKITIILVYADWCPHCHTYKPFWNKLSKHKNGNVGMIAAEQSNSQSIIRTLKNENGQAVNINAFPTVIAVNNQGTAVEIPNSRDETAMTNLVKNGDTIMNNNVGLEGEIEEEPEEVEEPTAPNTTLTGMPSMNVPSMKNLNKTIQNNLNLSNSKRMNMNSTKMRQVSLEDAGMGMSDQNPFMEMEEDEEIEPKVGALNETNRVFTPPVGESQMNIKPSNSTKIIGGAVKRGGSLYESLIAFATPAAPAAGLLAAQQMFGRSKKLRSKQRQTRWKKILKRSRNSRNSRHRSTKRHGAKRRHTNRR
jgi:thiol-disulfide isomerase/thioredoxin